jgi:hypothetical protein
MLLLVGLHFTVLAYRESSCMLDVQVISKKNVSLPLTIGKTIAFFSFIPSLDHSKENKRLSLDKYWNRYVDSDVQLKMEVMRQLLVVNQFEKSNCVFRDHKNILDFPMFSFSPSFL